MHVRPWQAVAAAMIGTIATLAEIREDGFTMAALSEGRTGSHVADSQQVVTHDPALWKTASAIATRLDAAPL